MSVTSALARGREALRRQAWAEAFAQLSGADREAPLEAADLEALATAAHLLGKAVECAALLTRAHQGYLTRGERHSAVRCAVWLALGALLGGEAAQASGWLSRAGRLLDEAGAGDCVERGYLLYIEALRAFVLGDVAAAEGSFRRVAELGARHHDPTLLALGLHGQGRSGIRRGDPARGVALLDESMVAVRAGDVEPRIVGGLYCSALEACGELIDVGRAQEWTGALEAWCAARPEVVPYRGFCLVHRAELLQLRGEWAEALRQIGEACTLLDGPRPGPALGAALALAGDLHRLRGEVPEAEAAYARASRWAPRPGLALLRLAQGQLQAAQVAARLAVEAASGGERARALEALLEVAMAAHEPGQARAAAAELEALAARFPGPYVAALSTRARGALLLAEGDAPGALRALRTSLAAWRGLDAPYEAARVEARLALACRAEGDEEGAELQLRAARRAFEALGAPPDVARVEGLLRRGPPGAPLTAREREVLALVASGRTNRAIAAELGLSEKTVARHLSNIFGKLDLSSRAAATAYAYEHGLAGRPAAPASDHP